MSVRETIAMASDWSGEMTFIFAPLSMPEIIAGKEFVVRSRCPCAKSVVASEPLFVTMTSRRATFLPLS